MAIILSFKFYLCICFHDVDKNECLLLGKYDWGQKLMKFDMAKEIVGSARSLTTLYLLNYVRIIYV